MTGRPDPPDLEFETPRCPLCWENTEADGSSFWCVNCGLAWDRDGAQGHWEIPDAPACRSLYQTFAELQVGASGHRCILPEGPHDNHYHPDAIWTWLTHEQTGIALDNPTQMEDSVPDQPRMIDGDCQGLLQVPVLTDDELESLLLMSAVMPMPEVSARILATLLAQRSELIGVRKLLADGLNDHEAWAEEQHRRDDQFHTEIRSETNVHWVVLRHAPCGQLVYGDEHGSPDEPPLSVLHTVAAAHQCPDPVPGRKDDHVD